MNRRNFLAGILAASAAPAIVRAASLMPVKVMDSGVLVPQWMGMDLCGVPDVTAIVRGRYVQMRAMYFTSGVLRMRLDDSDDGHTWFRADDGVLIEEIHELPEEGIRLTLGARP